MISRAPRTRGYSLIELLTVLTVLVILLSMCAGMIHSLMKLDRAGRSAMEEATDMARLSSDFRTDLHLATTGQIVMTSPDQLIWNGPENHSIEYKVREQDILKTVREGPKVRHYETYRRPSKTSVRFERADEGSRQFLLIRLDRMAPNANGSLYQDYRIEAEIGRDRRLTQGVQ